jgi:phage terminase Nu1 subunit (DNA packaging protein)
MTTLPPPTLTLVTHIETTGRWSAPGAPIVTSGDVVRLDVWDRAAVEAMLAAERAKHRPPAPSSRSEPEPAGVRLT